MTPHTLLTCARQLHSWGANVTAIRAGSKAPAHPWQQWQAARQTPADLEHLPWDRAAGVGVINGGGGWRTFDLDAPKDAHGTITAPVAEADLLALLAALGLPSDYPWTWRSGSGMGWGIAVCCEEPMLSGALPAAKSEAGVYWGYPPKDAGATFAHLELRWADCQTALPPSRYTFGKGAQKGQPGPGYIWRGQAPTAPPDPVSVRRCISAFYELCPPPPQTLGSLDEQTKETIRTRFDMVAFAQHELGGQLTGEGDEVRLLDHGGLLLKPSSGVWYCHGDQIGGDCFDLVAWAKYGVRYRQLNGHSAEVLQIAADHAGVVLPPRSPQPTGAATPSALPALPPTVPPAAQPAPLWERRWRILAEHELQQLQPPTWLIKQIIPAGEVTIVFGASDTGKTWIVVDMAKRVAQHYPVLYIAGEDAAGVRVRKRGWELHYGNEANGNFRMIADPFPLADPGEVAALIALIRDEGYGMIVIDTLSQCIAGMDENSNGEMSRVLQQCQDLAHQTGAAVVILHHTTKDGANYRGASALKNNTYGLLEVSRDDDMIVLECGRIKNSKPFATRRFRLVEVATDIHDADGWPIGSCVLKPARLVVPMGDELTGNQRKMLEALDLMTDATDGARTTELAQATGLNGNGFYSALRRLRQLELVSKGLDTRTAPLVITSKGKAWLARHNDKEQQATNGLGSGDAPLFEVNLALAPRFPGTGSSGEAAYTDPGSSNGSNGEHDGSNGSNGSNGEHDGMRALAAPADEAPLGVAPPAPMRDGSNSGIAEEVVPLLVAPCSHVATTSIAHADAVTPRCYHATTIPFSPSSRLGGVATTTLPPVGGSGGSTHEQEVHDDAPTPLDVALAARAQASLARGSVDTAYRQALLIKHVTLQAQVVAQLACSSSPDAIEDDELRTRVQTCVASRHLEVPADQPAVADPSSAGVDGLAVLDVAPPGVPPDCMAPAPAPPHTAEAPPLPVRAAEAR